MRSSLKLLMKIGQFRLDRKNSENSSRKMVYFDEKRIETRAHSIYNCPQNELFAIENGPLLTLESVFCTENPRNPLF